MPQYRYGSGTKVDRLPRLQFVLREWGYPCSPGAEALGVP